MRLFPDISDLIGAQPAATHFLMFIHITTTIILTITNSSQAASVEKLNRRRSKDRNLPNDKDEGAGSVLRGRYIAGFK